MIKVNIIRFSHMNFPNFYDDTLVWQIIIHKCVRFRIRKQNNAAMIKGTLKFIIKCNYTFQRSVVKQHLYSCVFFLYALHVHFCLSCKLSNNLTIPFCHGSKKRRSYRKDVCWTSKKSLLLEKNNLHKSIFVSFYWIESFSFL